MVTLAEPPALELARRNLPICILDDEADLVGEIPFVFGGQFEDIAHSVAKTSYCQCSLP